MYFLVSEKVLHPSTWHRVLSYGLNTALLLPVMAGRRERRKDTGGVMIAVAVQQHSEFFQNQSWMVFHNIPWGQALPSATVSILNARREEACQECLQGQLRGTFAFCTAFNSCPRVNSAEALTITVWTTGAQWSQIRNDYNHGERLPITQQYSLWNCMNRK